VRPHESHSKSPESSAKRRVLIVEDNDDVRDSLRALLEQSGHELYEAVDGPSGVERALEVRPDVVLIDLGLPGMDGYAVANSIRSAPGYSAVLVAITGYGQSEYRARATDAGFQAYLLKPVDPAELEKIIAQALSLRKCYESHSVGSS